MTDLHRFIFGPGVLLEPPRPDRRLALWVPTSDNAGRDLWDRVNSASPAEARRDGGFVLLPATTIRAREVAPTGVFGRITGWIGRQSDEKRWTLPDGRQVERCGERKVGLALVWPEDEELGLDEAAARSRWPTLTSYQPLGDRLALVGGILAANAPVENSVLSEPGNEHATSAVTAQRNLDAARQAGDPRREVIALADIAIVAMNDGKAQEAIDHLRQALELTRSLADTATELDVLNNLGSAHLALGQMPIAASTYRAGLSLARQVGDGYAEKLLVEGLALAQSSQGDVQGAYDLLTQALAMTRRAGDHQQESRLLWRLAILLAEIGRRDEALAFAEDSVALLRRLARPEAAWYSAQLQRYRTDQSGGLPDASPTPSSQSVTGPGLLRMALSATTAMMKFIGSGMKQAPTDVAHARLKTCQSCSHHTGLRCRICGCFTNVKTRMAHEQCPIGKWSG